MTNGKSVSVFCCGEERKKAIRLGTAFVIVCKKVIFYFPLFASIIYFSKAIVMEGVAGVGARISTLNP